MLCIISACTDSSSGSRSIRSRSQATYALSNAVPTCFAATIRPSLYAPNMTAITTSSSSGRGRSPGTAMRRQPRLWSGTLSASRDGPRPVITTAGPVWCSPRLQVTTGPTPSRRVFCANVAHATDLAGGRYPICVQAIEDRPADVPELTHLVRAQAVEQVLADRGDVPRRRPHQHVHAGLGEHGDRPAAVLGRGLPAHPAPVLQPGHRVREPARRRVGAHGEVAHP